MSKRGNRPCSHHVRDPPTSDNPGLIVLANTESRIRSYVAICLLFVYCLLALFYFVSFSCLSILYSATWDQWYVLAPSGVVHSNNY